jgi:hypothetical protein
MINSKEQGHDKRRALVGGGGQMKRAKESEYDVFSIYV